MTYPRLLATNLGDALRGSREDLVARWLERINARVTLKREDIFPTDELLNTSLYSSTEWRTIWRDCLRI